jgi:hypothetical protein
MNKKIHFAILPILALLVLGGLNVSRKITWREPERGYSL